MPLEFRFHTGSIKSMVDKNGHETYDGFDSILVRLKAWRDAGDTLKRPMFRFHTGSIKSADNSLYVELCQVSIPYWFD